MDKSKYEKADVRFNSGAGAVLCQKCSVILSYGFRHTDIEHYCGNCYNELLERIKDLEMPRRQQNIK